MTTPTLNSEANKSSTASSLLVAAALAGLIGALPLGCGTKAEPNADSSGTDSGSASAGAAGADAGNGSTYNNLFDGDAGTVTMADFRSLCESRGGYVYVNAACAGSAMCKGLSLHNGEIWDHSCRGQNSTCSGVGCLDLPADAGRSGQEIYETGPCGNCHADWSKTTDFDHPIVDYSRYAVFFNPQLQTADAAKAQFKASTAKRLESIVAWGTQGMHDDDDYTPYSNMPAYYQKYSLAEIRRVAAYVQKLCPFNSPYGVFGQDPPAGGLTSEDPDAACPK